MPRNGFVDDHLYATQPEMPHDRPVTRAEVWAWTQHWFADLKNDEALKAWAKGAWVWSYVYWVNFKGWGRPPDWEPGLPIAADACPKGAFDAGNQHNFTREVYRLLQNAQRAYRAQERRAA